MAMFWIKSLHNGFAAYGLADSFDLRRHMSRIVIKRVRPVGRLIAC